MFDRTRSLLRRLTDSSSDIALEDRRAHPRYDYNVETVCRLALPGSAPIFARVRDISRGGLKIQMPEPLEEGSLICVVLPQKDTEAAVTVLACVMHVSETPHEGFSHGCTFSAELEDGDLRNFGIRKEAAPSGDKRVWKRFETQGEVRAHRVPADVDAADFHGKIANISPTGVGLLLDSTVEPGGALRLELRRFANSRPVTILACAVYQGPKLADGWLVGCNFIHELSRQDMESFL